MNINVKNFFPNIKDESYEEIKNALIKKGTLTGKEMLKIIDDIKKIHPSIELVETAKYHVYSQSRANQIAKMIKKAEEQTAAGFAMVRQEDDYNVFNTFVETFGPKVAIKKFQEHINRRLEEFECIREKYPATKEVKEKF